MASIKSVGRLVYIEPNDLVANQTGGVLYDNVSWKPEDLNMSVDLQVIVPNRSDCGQFSYGSENYFVSTINYEEANEVGKFISFMQGADVTSFERSEIKTNHELTTDYINATYTELYKDGKSNKEALGIESIDITFDQHFYPQVNIKFIDVRGYSLMMPSEEEYLTGEELKQLYRGDGSATSRTDQLKNGPYTNFFKALFHFPYPRFLLTIKGYYGTSITFTLAVNEFKTNFNSQTGNFEVNVSFIGYMYGLYTDLPLNMLIAAPYYGLSSVNNQTSSVWSDSNYRFDNGNGGNGGEILTFLEFKKKLAELNEEELRISQGTSGYKSLERIDGISNEFKMLDDITKNLKKFVSAAVSGWSDTNENKGTVIQTKDGKNAIFYTSSTSDSVKIPVEEWNNFVSSWEEYGKTYTLDIGNWIDPNLYSNNDGKWRTLSNGTNSYLKTFGPLLRKGNKGEVDKDAIIENNCPTKNNRDIPNSIPELYNLATSKQYIGLTSSSNMVYILTSIIEDSISARREALTTERVNLSVEARKEKGNMYNNVLGFTPNILNVFRFIFAHINCFMKVYYDTLSQIREKFSKGERYFKNFSDCGMSINMSDLNQWTKEKDMVPPFPAFYKEVDGRREEIYPGDIDGLRDLMPEIDLVENLLIGSLGLKKRANQIDASANENASHTLESLSAAGNTSFTPSLMTDICHVSKPYGETTTDFGNVLYTFILRYAGALVQFQDGNTVNSNIANIESETYLKIFQTPMSRMKEEMKAAKNDPVGQLKQYLNKRGLTTNLIFNKNGTISIKKKDIPVYFETIKKSEGSSQVKFDKDGKYKKSDRIYKKYSHGDTSLISDFTSRIGESSYGEMLKGRIKSNDRKVNFSTADGMPDILPMPNLTGVDSLDSTWFWKPLGSNGNENGDLFFSDLFKNGFQSSEYPITNNSDISDRKFCAFLMAFIWAQKRPHVNAKSQSNGVATLEFKNIGKTGITRISNPELLLLGCILKNRGKVGFWYKEDGTQLRVTDGNNHIIYDFGCENFIEKYKGTKLEEDIIAHYNTFKNGPWNNKILPVIAHGYNYEKKGDKYLMKKPLKQRIMDTIYADNELDSYLYCIEDEFNGNTVTLDNDTIKIFIENLLTDYNDKKTALENSRTSAAETDITTPYKLSLYNSLKNLYDKWTSSYNQDDFILRSPEEDRLVKNARYVDGESFGKRDICEFDNFVFVDCFFNDLSYKFYINPESINKIIDRHLASQANYSTYQFMAELMQENRMLFQALPVYNNFYNMSTIGKVFTPDIKESMVRGLGTTYMCMYTYEVSHVVNDGKTNDHLQSDGIDDLVGITGDVGPVSSGTLFANNAKGAELPITVPSFGVTYARQNQMYFKNVNVNMDNPRMTDYSIANVFNLADPMKDNAMDKPHPIANDIYSIYANRSYECSVDMMGCANIMPMMYFQLNNIPMFRGAYMIYSVSHHIQAGDFTTSFKGVRISKNQLPYNIEMFAIDGINDYRGGSNVGSYLDVDITTQCGEFNVEAAIQMMGQEITCTTKEGTKNINGPITTTSSSKVCACCVRHFIAAGLNRDSKDYDKYIEIGRNGYPNAIHWHLDGSLKKIGFSNYGNIPAGSSRETVKAWCAKNCLQGDIAVMYRENQDNAAGHICMYYGNGIWVSDFRQENGPYVYFSDKEPVTSRPIFVYRHKGCKYVKPEKPVNITDKNERGKIIMKKLQSAFGFSDNQVIGIGSSLYYESGWNPIAVGDSGKARGIAQWHADRQFNIVNYINSKYNYHYSVGQSFSSMSLEQQVEGIIYELNHGETATRDALLRDKDSMTAATACDIWTKKYERPLKSTYKKHCQYIELARKALYS